MAKKLKVSLELDTSAARRTLTNLSSSAGGGEPSTSRLSSAFESTTKSVEKATSAFDKMEGKAADLTRGFAGIAIGMAASYASNYVSNPNAKATFGYAGNIMAGAAAGAMFGGPVGAVVGGAAGAVKTYMENEGEKSAISKELEQSEKIYAAIREKNALFEKLSDTKNGTDIASNLAKAKEIIENYTETTADFVQQVRDELKRMHPDKEKIAKLRRNIDYNRGEIQRYEGLVKSLEGIQAKADSKPAARASMSALDSLSKVGGIMAAAASPDAPAQPGAAPSGASSGLRSFGFAVAPIAADTTEFSSRAEGLMDGTAAALKTANERIEKIDSEQLRVLTEIKDTLRNQGVTTWQ